MVAVVDITLAVVGFFRLRDTMALEYFLFTLSTRYSYHRLLFAHRRRRRCSLAQEHKLPLQNTLISQNAIAQWKEEKTLTTTMGTEEHKEGDEKGDNENETKHSRPGRPMQTL